MRFLPILLLSACLGPLVTDDCVANDTKEFQLCDISLDANDEEDIQNTCALRSGYARGVGCAAEAAAVEKCHAEILATNPLCEDINDELDACNYEVGLYNGCIDRG